MGAYGRLPHSAHGFVVCGTGNKSTTFRIRQIGFLRVETTNKRQDHECIKQIREPGVWKSPLLPYECVLLEPCHVRSTRCLSLGVRQLTSTHAVKTRTGPVTIVCSPDVHQTLVLAVKSIAGGTLAHFRTATA